MYAPPTDPRYRPVPEHVTWSGVLASYAIVAAVPLSLWVLHRPLVRTVALAAVAVALVGARRVSKVVWCVRVCRELTVDLPGGVEVTITRPRSDCPC